MFKVVRGCGHYAPYGVNILNPGTSVLLFALCRNCQAVWLFVSHIKHLTPNAFNKIPTNNTCFDDTKFPFNIVYTFLPYIFFDATPTLSASNFTDFVYCNEIVAPLSLQHSQQGDYKYCTLLHTAWSAYSLPGIRSLSLHITMYCGSNSTKTD
jgi:hypothetical protein